MDAPAPDSAIFSHIRVVMGMIISLSLARPLSGVALFIQHPGKTRVFWIHLGWVLFLFIFLVHFWWWEYHLHALPAIDVTVYLFVILYACVFFLPERAAVSRVAGGLKRIRTLFHVAPRLVLRLSGPRLPRRFGRHRGEGKSLLRILRHGISAAQRGLHCALHHRCDDTEPPVPRRLFWWLACSIN